MFKPQYVNVAGSFECVVLKPEAGWFGEASEKQTPFVRIIGRVIEGPEAGHLITYRAWLSDKALDSTIGALALALKWDGDLYALHTGRTTLEGRLCNIVTEMETYNNKLRCNAKWINPPGGGAIRPLETAKVESMLAKLSARCKAVAKTALAEAARSGALPAPGTGRGVVPPAAPVASGSEVPFENDDVPF
jgi:hypothetical protein